MKDQNSKIHIALAFDENYITPFYVLLTSIFINNKGNDLAIHAIATGVTDLEKSKISDYTHENNADITYYEIDSSFKIEELDTPYLKSTGWTVAAYYRLYFPFLIDNNIDQLLYLDTDTVVLGNLEEIYQTNINPLAAGAIPDIAMFRNNDPRIIKLGVIKEDYFNSGVLLINIRQWKNQKITEKTVDFIKENEELVKFPDQDALNYILRNNYYKLPSQYNFTWDDIPVELTKKEILKGKITILHYTGIKPWKFLNPNRLRSFYYYYLKRSPQADKKKYVDYQFTKSNLINFIKIRVVEYYLDQTWLRKIRGRLNN